MATHKPFVSFIQDQFSGGAIDWDAVDLKVSAHSATYTPNRETHNRFDDVTNELTGTNWPAGGVSLGARTVTYDAGTRQVRLLGGAAISVDDVVLTGVRYFVIRNATPVGAANQQLISIIDLEANEDVDGTVSITWDATGVGRFTLPA